MLMNYTEIIKNTLIKAKETFDKVRSSQEFSKKIGIGYGTDVTMYFDKEVEKTVIDAIKDYCNKILTEEAGILEINNGDLNAIVDPVDGSINALRGIPFYSSSIALFKGDKFRDAIAAGIINLANGDLILTDTKEVYINGKALKKSPYIDYKELVVGSDLKIIDVNDPNIDNLIKIFKNFRYLRFLGSLALELSYVALGTIDAFIVPFKRIRFLDIAAGLILVKASGGYAELLNEELNELNIFTPKRVSFIVAKNEDLGKYIKSLILSS
jgi:Archaeal fructose-1,6-bisphosphatase and related enzymes of inositol monophosphatase family